MKIRECFVPRTGFVFAQADYSQLELRTLAQVCVTLFGHSRLAEVLNADKDPHLEVAAQILGLSYEETEQRKKTEEVKDARQLAKCASFGYPGGLGVGKFIDFAKTAYGVTITESGAKKLKAQWLRAYPEMNDFFRYVDRLGDGPVEHIFSKRLRGGASYTAKCNSFFQGLGADATTRAGWVVTRACYAEPSSVLYGSHITAFIHDELILEVPEDRGHECAYELSRLMIAGAKEYLPDLTVKADPVLMRRWSKDAEAKFNSEGRLIPWDDVTLSNTEEEEYHEKTIQLGFGF